MNYQTQSEYFQATKNLPKIPYIETMITHGCTLSCYGCTNYSDYGMSGGNVSWDKHFEDLKVLFNRLRVDCYGFIGGEPFMHKGFKDWVVNFNQEFPFVTLQILTNAQMFPENADWFLDCMEQYGNMYIKFSNHIPNAKYFEESKKLIFDKFDWQLAPSSHSSAEKYVDRVHNNTFEIFHFPGNVFLKSFKGEYGSTKPYDNDPIKAFDVCQQQLCPLFYEGKLHKCSTVGMLDRMLADHNQLDDPDWAPYINQGLDIRTVSDEVLKNWADNFGKPHMRLCRMCPTLKDSAFFNHIVLVKNKLGKT